MLSGASPIALDGGGDGDCKAGEPVVAGKVEGALGIEVGGNAECGKAGVADGTVDGAVDGVVDGVEGDVVGGVADSTADGTAEGVGDRGVPAEVETGGGTSGASCTSCRSDAPVRRASCGVLKFGSPRPWNPKVRLSNRACTASENPSAHWKRRRSRVLVRARWARAAMRRGDVAWTGLRESAHDGAPARAREGAISGATRGACVDALTGAGTDEGALRLPAELSPMELSPVEPSLAGFKRRSPPSPLARCGWHAGHFGRHGRHRRHGRCEFANAPQRVLRRVSQQVSHQVL